ncbi:hypothetical protein KEG38_30465 [Polyangium jinanense]|nr:hypothetical protein [Polyangium jinanense]
MAREQLCACPCCGLLTLPDRGHYEICDVCGWEDDPIQDQMPDREGGANAVSLNQARRNYVEFGTSDPALRRHEN